MPHYRIDVTSSDGAIDSPDRDGITHIGTARALVVATLIEAAREKPPAGKNRVITAVARDEHGVVYSDRVTVWGRSADDAAVGRAIEAMQRGA